MLVIATFAENLQLGMQTYFGRCNIAMMGPFINCRDFILFFG
jgi:hypothetical protein